MGNQVLTKKQYFYELPKAFPKGSLIEVSGPLGGGKLEVTLNHLVNAPRPFKVGWVGCPLVVNPEAIAQKGISLKDVLFLETSRSVWACQQLLRSQLFSFVVVQAQINETLELRRLQLASEKCHAVVFLIKEVPTADGTWPIYAQFYINRRLKESGTNCLFLKYRGKRILEEPLFLTG